MQLLLEEVLLSLLEKYDNILSEVVLLKPLIFKKIKNIK